MNAQIRTLILAATSLSAFGMTYEPTIVGPVVTFPPPPPQIFSSCTTASNTIAVGIEYHTGGARILCADAGQIGFWTTVVPGSLQLGNTSAGPMRILCPSGSALSGVFLTEGLTLPFPICSVLIPNLQNGTVTRGGIMMGSGTLCASNKFIQALRQVSDSQGAFASFNTVCNPVVTNPAPIENFDVDLAVRTIGQDSSLSHNGSDVFTAQVWNLGMATITSALVRLEFRFNTSAWDLVPGPGVACQTMFASVNGLLRSIGERCALQPSLIFGRGGNLANSFTLQPVGPESGRPVTGAASVIVTVSAVLASGTAPNAGNDMARFPVTLF